MQKYGEPTETLSTERSLLLEGRCWLERLVCDARNRSPTSRVADDAHGAIGTAILATGERWLAGSRSLPIVVVDLDSGRLLGAGNANEAATTRRL